MTDAVRVTDMIGVVGIDASDYGDAEQDRLVRQVIHAANQADEAMLQDALEAMGVDST